MTQKKRNNKWLKRAAFGTVGAIVLILMVATVVEKLYGSEFARERIYTSLPMVVLWGVATLLALLYIFRSAMRRRIVTLTIHLAFVVILAGALTTHIWGVQGNIHLRSGEPNSEVVLPDGESHTLPFALTLNDFEVVYYEGTFAPMDYVSRLTTSDQVEGVVSMNNIFRHRNYRFYQAGYDPDGLGATLAVNYDPWGIGITYTGYALLLLSLIGFFFERGTGFRALLRHPALRRGALIVLFAVVGLQSAVAAPATAPKTLPRDVAEEFCDLAVYYNDRICPLGTLARDFTVKLYGKPSYKGLTAEQVLCGWFFYYDDWKREEMIKIKGGEIRSALGTEGKYAALTDFTSRDGYKLDPLLRSSNQTLRRNAESANEKFNLVSMVCMGNMLKIYPCGTPDSEEVVWYSLADRLPGSVPYEKWLFVTQSMNLVAERIAMRDWAGTTQLLDKIATYQHKEAGEGMPSEARFGAEKIYNHANINRPLAMACATIGIVLFLVFALSERVRRGGRGLKIALRVGLALLWLYLTAQIALRWIVSGNVPLGSGFETMQFMAWCCALLTLLGERKLSMALPFGYLLCGLTLLVSMMGEATPQITQLMPVLQSPLLSSHVMVIMVAYSLFAFAMMNGVSASVLWLRNRRAHADEIERLAVLSRLMLYPAVFLLTIGIFIGAVWANVSWGRYWGWDPKEVWALITMLIYAAALHTTSLKPLARPMRTHIFGIVAFLSVLITYFGVNLLLGGLHSYA